MVDEVHRNRLRRRHLPILRRRTASALIAAIAAAIAAIAAIATIAAIAAAIAAIAAFVAARLQFGPAWCRLSRQRVHRRQWPRVPGVDEPDAARAHTHAEQIPEQRPGCSQLLSQPGRRVRRTLVLHDGPFSALGLLQPDPRVSALATTNFGITTTTAELFTTAAALALAAAALALAAAALALAAAAVTLSAVAAAAALALAAAAVTLSAVAAAAALALAAAAVALA